MYRTLILLLFLAVFLPAKSSADSNLRLPKIPFLSKIIEVVGENPEGGDVATNNSSPIAIIKHMESEAQKPQPEALEQHTPPESVLAEENVIAPIVTPTTPAAEIEETVKIKEKEETNSAIQNAESILFEEVTPEPAIEEVEPAPTAPTASNTVEAVNTAWEEKTDDLLEQKTNKKGFRIPFFSNVWEKTRDNISTTSDKFSKAYRNNKREFIEDQLPESEEAATDPDYTSPQEIAESNQNGSNEIAESTSHTPPKTAAISANEQEIESTPDQSYGLSNYDSFSRKPKTTKLKNHFSTSIPSKPKTEEAPKQDIAKAKVTSIIKEQPKLKSSRKSILSAADDQEYIGTTPMELDVFKDREQHQIIRSSRSLSSMKENSDEPRPDVLTTSDQ